MKIATFIALSLSIASFLLFSLQTFEVIPSLTWKVDPQAARNFMWIGNLIGFGGGWIFYGVLLFRQK